MQNHIMIDIETMGKGDDAVITTIGAVVFDPNTGEHTSEFYCVTKMREQIDSGRYVDADTLKWWLEQSDEARQALFAPNALPIKEALRTLGVFVYKAKKNANVKKMKVWSNGSNFDIAILTNAYKQYDIEVPWHYRDVRDVRTIVDLASHLVQYGDVKFEGEKHNALADAIHQAKYTSTRWQALKRVANIENNEAQGESPHDEGRTEGSDT